MKNISYRSAGTLQNRYKFNGGNEYEEEGELNYDATFYRKYDAQVGRFTGVDMYAEKFSFINPYQFGGDNPVMSNDPTGDLMTPAQFKQIRDYNKLDIDDKLMVGDWSSMPFRDAGGGGGASAKSGVKNTRRTRQTTLQIINNMIDKLNNHAELGSASWGDGMYTYYRPITGVRVISAQAKTITVISKYYVVTDEKIDSRQYGYTKDDIKEMNTYRTYLNSLNKTVSEGTFKDYKMFFDLQFFDGGNIFNAENLAKNETFQGYLIGNTMHGADAETEPAFRDRSNDETTFNLYAGLNPDGNITMNIGMNSFYDRRENRIHEFFHQFGFEHSDLKSGIMDYNKKKINQWDIDRLGNPNNSSLPIIYVP